MNEQQRADFAATLALVMEVMDASNSHVISSIEKQEKMTWLEEFSRQPIAWNVAVDLLTRPEYHVQAAAMLTDKVNHSWNSLLEEHKKELCDVVLTTIANPDSPPRLKVCLIKTVTHIILQSTPHEWPDPIADTLYLAQYDPEAPYDSRVTWVELVRTIAEEVNKSPKFIQQSQHDILKKYIRDVSAETVIKTLLIILEQTCTVTQTNLAEDTLEALCKWYCLAPAVTPVMVQTVDCVVSSVLVSPATLTLPAAEVISEVLLNWALPQHPQSIAHILEHVLRLAPLVPQALESMEEDVISGLVSIFTSIGINQASVLTAENCRENGFLLAQLVLQCCEHQDAISSEIFDFWKELQDTLEEHLDYDDLLDIYKPAMEEMVRTFLKQSRFPEEPSKLDPDTSDKTYNIRRDAADTLLQFYRMIPEEELDIMYSLLENSIGDYERQPSYEAESWIEVALWGWSCVSEDFADEQVWPAKLLNLFYALPSNSVFIHKTALELIKALSPWLALHPNSIPMALTHICSALEGSELAEKASECFAAIADDCGEHLPNLLEELLDKLEPVMGGLPSKIMCKITTALSSQVTYLETSQGVNLLGKLAGTLPAELVALTQETNQFNLLQKERLINGLNFIIALLASPGDALERTETRRVQILQPAPKTTPEERYMEQVTWAQDVLLSFVDQTWPIIEAIVNGADLDDAYCDPVIKYIRRVSESLRRFVFSQYLPKALNVLTIIFQRTLSVDAFKQYDVLSGIYRTMYRVPDLQRLLKPEIEHIVELGLLEPAPSASIENPPCATVIAFSNTFTTLADTCLQLFAGDNIAEEVEIITCFYQFSVISTLVHLPRAFFSNVQCVIALSEFAANVLPGLTNVRDIQMIGKFFRTLFDVDVTHALSPADVVDFNSFKNNIFEVLLNNVFLCIGTSIAPRQTIPTYAEMVHYYLVTYPQLFTSTLELLLSKPGFPSEEISNEKKKEFFGRIIQSQKAPNYMSATLQEFSVICRGIQSTFLANLPLR